MRGSSLGKVRTHLALTSEPYVNLWQFGRDWLTQAKVTLPLLGKLEHNINSTCYFDSC